MNSNLPIKEENSFLGRIKNFFKKLFPRKNIEYDIENTVKEETTSKENENKDKFQENIKIEVKNDYINDIKREEFLDNIENNPELLYDLPIEKLEKLENYYKTSIKNFEEKLAKIKKAS